MKLCDNPTFLWLLLSHRGKAGMTEHTGFHEVELLVHVTQGLALLQLLFRVLTSLGRIH